MKTFVILLTLGLFSILPSPAFCQGTESSEAPGRGVCNSAYTYNASGAWVDFAADVVDSTWTYAWDFGDGNTGAGYTGFNYYAVSGMYNVCLTVTDSLNNCTSTFCDSIPVVIPVCNSSYVYSTDSTGTYTFEVQPVTSGFTYFWDFGDGGFTQGDSVTNTFQNSGVFTVCLYTNDTLSGCNSSYCDTIDVFVPVNCSATFFAFPGNGTASFFVQGMNPGMTYTFNFGDSTTGAPNGFGFATHNYPAGGVFNVCLNVADSASGCTSTFCDTVVVPACTVSADFVVTNLPNGQIFVDALQTGFQYQFSWGIFPPPDDTLITGFGRDTVTYGFTTNGLKSVCLRVQDVISPGCSDSLCKFVTISGIGIEEYNALNQSLSVYPNPASDLLNLNFTVEKNETVSIMITDLSGKLILQQNEGVATSGQHSIKTDIHSLASGTYIIQLNAGDVTVNRRFTRQ